jgi:hypothetical protein
MEGTEEADQGSSWLLVRRVRPEDVIPNSLLVCLAGDRPDGHTFVLVDPAATPGAEPLAVAAVSVGDHQFGSDESVEIDAAEGSGVEQLTSLLVHVCDAMRACGARTATAAASLPPDVVAALTGLGFRRRGDRLALEL